MKHLIAFLIIFFSLVLFLFTTRGDNKKYFQLTNRPNKFISEGDILDLGSYKNTKFSLMFMCKINNFTSPIISFNNLKLIISGKDLIFNSSILKLSVSPYETFEWFQIIAYGNPNLIVLLNNKPYIFQDPLPETFNLCLGDVQFSGAFADIFINNVPAYCATVPGVNQVSKPNISVAGFNDFGLYGSDIRYQQVQRIVIPQNNHKPPKFKISKDIAFSVNITARILSDGVYFVFIPNNVYVGRNIDSITSPKIDIKTMDVKIFDTLTFITQLSSPTKLNIFNTNNYQELQETFPEALPANYTLQPGDPKICLITELIHRDRPVWQAGLNFDEQNDTDANFNMDYTGAYVKIFNLPEINPWTCEFQFIYRGSKEVCLMAITAKNYMFSIAIKGKDIIIRERIKLTQVIDNLVAPEDLSFKINKLHITYNGYFSITLFQLGKIRKYTLFSPDLVYLFRNYNVFFGAMNPVNINIPDAKEHVFLNFITICGIPFRDLPYKILVKDTTDIIGSILSVELPFQRNALLFSLKTNKSIGIFIRDGDIYLFSNKTEILIEKSLVKIPGIYKFQLKLDKECILLITNPHHESISYRFIPGLLPTKIVTVKLPDVTSSKVSFLGRICSL